MFDTDCTGVSPGLPAYRRGPWLDLPDDRRGPWLDLAVIEREMGDYSLVTVWLEELLETGELFQEGPRDYTWTDGREAFWLRVRPVGRLLRLVNRIRGRHPVEDYVVERMTVLGVGDRGHAGGGCGDGWAGADSRVRVLPAPCRRLLTGGF